MPTFEILSPKYSLVDFNPSTPPACCQGADEIVLPVAANDDLIFQVRVKAISVAAANVIFEHPAEAMQLRLASLDGSVIHNWTVTDGLLFEKYRTDIDEITYLWRVPLAGLTEDLVDCDQCFRLQVMGTFTFDSEPEQVQCNSNVFRRICNSCYTSVIEYFNEESYADFHYCNVSNAINRARLHVYLSRPKTIEDKAVYRKSNGAIRQTRSLLTKEYQAQTEHYTEAVHDKIAVALAHDEVKITSETYTGGISKSGEYEIAWDGEIEICTAPGAFKALATPYAIRNDSCGDCNPVIVPGLCAKITGILGETIEEDPDWSLEITGLEFEEDITVDHTVEILYREYGSGSPFVSAGVLTITPAGVVSPNPLEIGGISGSWNRMEVRAVNDCDSGVFTKVFRNPALPDCDPVDIAEPVELPDAIIGQPYEFSFDLEGSEPFTIENVIKPTWMTIAITGNTVSFSGTPTEELEANISFTIYNCDYLGDYYFTSPFVVKEPPLGDITFNCNFQPLSYDPLTFGVPGNSIWNSMQITTITPGQVTLIAHNDQAGTLNGYAIYGSQTINIAPGTTSVVFPVQYDGGGLNQFFEMIFTVIDASGTQTCRGHFYSYS
ncbi:hypothetical protein JMG10_07610 [Nostoc ellipsosporum NOK]|nr:hypothetical protein [Nostoc ellipsosporum NOK]